MPFKFEIVTVLSILQVVMFFVIAVNANILYAIILSNDTKPGTSPFISMY